VWARLLAQRKQFDSGEALAREAVELARRTDLATTRADSLFDLAEVLDSAGRMVDAAAAIREALELYREKGDVVSADRALLWLSARGVTHT
jgi:Flp pilus assembly protein TadD